MRDTYQNPFAAFACATEKVTMRRVTSAHGFDARLELIPVSDPAGGVKGVPAAEVRAALAINSSGGTYFWYFASLPQAWATYKRMRDRVLRRK